MALTAGRSRSMARTCRRLRHTSSGFRSFSLPRAEEAAITKSTEAMRWQAPARATRGRTLATMQVHVPPRKIGASLAAESVPMEHIPTSTRQTGMIDLVGFAAFSLETTVAYMRLSLAESPEQTSSTKKKGSTSDKRKEQVRRMSHRSDQCGSLTHSSTI